MFVSAAFKHTVWLFVPAAELSEAVLFGATTTVSGFAEIQPLLLTFTVYVPAAEIAAVWLVPKAFDQKYVELVAGNAVATVVPPEHKLSAETLALPFTVSEITDEKALFAPEHCTRQR
jgi:hypothetical protein